ncbi:Disulfide bond formation protein D precursor [compost metagenome]
MRGINLKKRSLVIMVLLVLAVFLSVIGVVKSAEKSELEKIPSLMDASGKITLTVGDFRLEKQPSMGDVNAPIKVIEFVDYKCPACKQWDKESFPAFKQKFIDTGIVQFHVINFPFLGPDSIEAAMAAESIYQQNVNKFWATEKFLKNFVKKNISGIDQKKFVSDMEKNTYLLDVKEDFKIAAANGIYGTPTFVVDGVIVKVEELEDKVLQMK